MTTPELQFLAPQLSGLEVRDPRFNSRIGSGCSSAASITPCIVYHDTRCFMARLGAADMRVEAGVSHLQANDGGAATKPRPRSGHSKSPPTEQQFDERLPFDPTPFSRTVAQFDAMAQQLKNTTSLVHRDWFFEAVSTMQKMDEDLRSQHRDCNRLRRDKIAATPVVNAAKQFCDHEPLSPRRQPGHRVGLHRAVAKYRERIG